MADEAEPRAAETAARHGVHAERGGRYGDAFLAGALAHDAVVVRRTGGFEMHGGRLAEIIEPVQHVLVFLRRDHLIRKLGGPAHRHQQEDMPRRRADALAEFEYLLKIMQVIPSDRSVDLKLHALGLETLDAAHGGVERAGHTAERIVFLGVVAVDGDRTALHARFLDLTGVFRRDERPVGGHHAAQALGTRIGDQLVYIGADHGIAAGENDDRVAHAREGIDQRLGFFRGQLARIGFRMRLGPAMFAGKVTGAGHFPRDKAAQRGTVLKRARTGGHTARMPGVAAGMSGAGAGIFPPHAAWRLMAIHQRTHPFLRASSA